MKIVTAVAELRQILQGQSRTAFVPTMGNLHAGHLSLVQLAQTYGDPVVVSIFVNRLQFAPHEDFETYPRTFDADIAQLERAHVDIVFAPSEKDLYPEPQTCRLLPSDDLSTILEGAFRPGFFIGVATVVLKLFGCVQPHIAVFGKKDYQQLTIICHMVRQFNLPIKIMAADTTRAADGLALSSRNSYLSPTERIEAATLYQTLHDIAEQIRSGHQHLGTLEQHAMLFLQHRGWQPDYIAIRTCRDLQTPAIGELVPSEPWVVLAAARLGQTRLIDNIEIL